MEEDFQLDLPVTEVIVHPNYKTAPEGFDIAVYKVKAMHGASYIWSHFHEDIFE